MLRLVTIGFIWLGCSAAWLILGGVIVHRTGETSGSLMSEVHGLWGPSRTQEPPSASFKTREKVKEEVTGYDTRGRAVVSTILKEVEKVHAMYPASSLIHAELVLEHRRKGLLWFPTYEVEFDGRYRFENDGAQPREVEVVFPLETGGGVYDGFFVKDEAGAPVKVSLEQGQARWTTRLAPGESRSWTVSYRSRGTSLWRYGGYNGLAGGAGQARDFELTVNTNFADVNFPAGTLSPSRHGATSSGWSGTWSFDSIVTSAPIGLELPQKLNPGPLASKITFFAPVSLLFFTFVVAVLAAARGKNIHPMNYFFFGCAFFAFHLLFAYLLDHLSIVPAFTISSLVSIFLVVTYARLFTGWHFALREMGIAQLLYLVLFSFTFFWDGFTGLAITVGAVLTLFVMMQITGRLDWQKTGLPQAAAM